MVVIYDHKTFIVQATGGEIQALNETLQLSSNNFLNSTLPSPINFAPFHFVYFSLKFNIAGA